MKKATVIGAGFSGLAASICLAEAGLSVSVFERHAGPGGRARKFSSNGFTFDMGPSWYWMPDVYERFFSRFGRKTSDYYELLRLDPSYRIYFGKGDYWDLPANFERLVQLFDQVEQGAGEKLLRFLEDARFKYEAGINKFVYNPGVSWTELFHWDIITGAAQLQLFSSVSDRIRKYFKDPRIIQLLEFPVLFLGSTPERTPALYTMMNYADMVLGTWYPVGGMYKVVEAMETLAKEKGVRFYFGSDVSDLSVRGKTIEGVVVKGNTVATDSVVAAADYHYVEQMLLPEHARKYSSEYWQTRVLTPSSLIFYLGFNKKIKGLQHHTLFFDTDFAAHAAEIYDTPRWPTAPQFYVSCPSKTDPSVAPEGFENVMILIPVAADLVDTPDVREKYFKMVIARLESLLGEDLGEHIVFKRSYAHRDFVHDYNSYKGNAYGLANTLRQTANLRPSMVSSKIANLFYAGHLTVPGPGVPPSIISGQVAAKLAIEKLIRA